MRPKWPSKNCQFSKFCIISISEVSLCARRTHTEKDVIKLGVCYCPKLSLDPYRVWLSCQSEGQI